MQTVRVELGGRSYPIHIGPGARSALGDALRELRTVRRIAIIADQRVADLHLDAMLAALPDHEPKVLTFPPGEDSKSLATFGRLLDGVAEARLERGDLVITLGGGVAGDLGGFVAATWVRGVRFVQVGTTIEAAVDASVGGKTAVNHKSGKNMIGAFHQPSAVIIDTDFLETLDDRDFVAGLSESLKHGVISDADFVTWHATNVERILARDPAVVAELIAWNCRIKADLVARDEREESVRANLNYGHTIGHAAEQLTDFALRHGEAVALGIVAENAIAVARGMADPAAAQRVDDLLARLGLPTRLSRQLDPHAVIEVCRHDKKNRGGRITFILLDAIGRVQRVDDVSDDEIRAGLDVIQP